MINLEKSIRQKRLIYNISISYILELVLDYIIWLGLLSVSVGIIVDNQGQIILKIIFLIIALWLIVGLWFKNKLVPVSGGDLKNNREMIISLFNNKFPKSQLDKTNEKVIYYEKGVGLFNWGKTITIIFDANSVYINWITLGRFDIKSPFHAPLNYFELRKIKRQIEEKR
jgi:hypothetical protein